MTKASGASVKGTPTEPAARAVARSLGGRCRPFPSTQHGSTRAAGGSAVAPQNVSIGAQRRTAGPRRTEPCRTARTPLTFGLEGMCSSQRSGSKGPLCGGGGFQLGAPPPAPREPLFTRRHKSPSRSGQWDIHYVPFKSGERGSRLDDSCPSGVSEPPWDPPLGLGTFVALAAWPAADDTGVRGGGSGPPVPPCSSGPPFDAPRLPAAPVSPFRQAPKMEEPGGCTHLADEPTTGSPQKERGGS